MDSTEAPRQHCYTSLSRAPNNIHKALRLNPNVYLLSKGGGGLERRRKERVGGEEERKKRGS